MPSVSAAEARNWMRSYILENFEARDYDEFVTRLNSSASAEVPLLGTDAELQRDLTISTRSQLLAFMSLTLNLDDSAAEQDIHPPEEAHDLARTIARRGLDLRVLSQMYHAGHRAMLSYVTEFIEKVDLTSEFKLALVTMMWEQTAEWINRTLEELTLTYTAERESLLQGAFSLRADTIREILDGTQSDESRASGLLGYALPRRHTALALWTENPEPGSAGTGKLERLVQRLASGHHPADVLITPSGTHGVWAWIAEDERVSHPLGRLPWSDGAWGAELGDDGALAGGLRIAVGEPARGITGFRQTHREAMAAQRIAEADRRQPTCTRYGDVELVAMITKDAEALHAFVTRTVGPLLAAGTAHDQLRATLLAFLTCQGNQEATARRLEVHKNTVRYRLQRLHELLDRDLYADRASLDLAMQCVSIFGVDYW